MSLLDIPLDKVTEAELQNLVAAKVSESTYLDYKQQTYADGDDARSEFLADVSAFANTLGGDIIVGVAEHDGVAAALTPFQGDVDKEMRRLEQIALAGLEPRISNMRVRAIPVASGGHILIIRIPRSFLPPHRVVARSSNKFWARAGTVKYQPNVQQLRQLFNDAPHMAERIRSFLGDRLVKINAGDTPIPLSASGKMVVHVIPAPTFADDRLADIVQVMASGTHVPLPPGEFGGSNQAGVNLDGFLNSTHPNDAVRSAYAQFFRNGAIEGVRELSYEPDGQSRFIGRDLTTLVINAVRQYLGVLKSYETGLPIYIFVSLCNATKTVYRHSPEGLGWSDTKPVGREIVVLPEIYLDSYDADVPSVLRPVFNVLWNAVGFPQCDMYDGQGQWRGSISPG
ncbi:MAG: ATP-binding protein [Paraburkholderia sp.]|uniref:AlbA family DNA-binding domain-containing protein n=1 Tax=Paraburkholderia sp. TaxID=1926495 RepID=UPI0012216B6B|nr:ATP-binding protein [Paraburkholderia sp.]TAM04895.1 MAG: ATP-binding protein [Paraburkholderia sp.]TAM29601.1 MAG: ATP-binding protein [Paraburkholderia sp.]